MGKIISILYQMLTIATKLGMLSIAQPIESYCYVVNKTNEIFRG